MPLPPYDHVIETSSHRAERISELDRQLVGITKEIRVLGALSWPPEAVDAFLASWRRGEPRLPVVEYPRGRHREELEALADVRRRLDLPDPAQRFLDESAGSYRAAALMLENVGTPSFLELSLALYGKPTDPLPGAHATHLEAADQLLAATERFADAGLDVDADASIPSEEAAAWMRERLASFFDHHAVEVVVDPSLGARATAGAQRVRLRGGTLFSELELVQLVEHEAFVHAATALNGREQPVLKMLGLGAPRTTLTQEGLATVAELATRSIDLARLRRIALRIRAIHLAMEGADFVDVFRFFLEEGQSEEESVRSAMRVFRGGDVRGRWVFTKDVVYLQGLVAVHTFLRKAITEHRPFLIERLFAGRMALSDVFLLEETFAERLVAPPVYVPDWARNVRSLAAYLAFSAITSSIDLGAIELEDILPSSGFA